LDWYYFTLLHNYPLSSILALESTPYNAFHVLTGAPMIVKFTFKVSSSDSHTYDFEYEEYRHFRTDYESYVLSGLPKGGVYVCSIVEESVKSCITSELIIDFASIAFVDVQVQLERLKELRRQSEEAKHKAIIRKAKILN
jgi:hypothetical protein